MVRATQSKPPVATCDAGVRSTASAPSNPARSARIRLRTCGCRASGEATATATATCAGAALCIGRSVIGRAVADGAPIASHTPPTTTARDARHLIFMVTSGGRPPGAADATMFRGTHAAHHGPAGADWLHPGQARACLRATLPAGKRWLAVSLADQAHAGMARGRAAADAGSVLGSYDTSSWLSETAPRRSASL